MIKLETVPPVVRMGIIVVVLCGALLSLLGRHYYQYGHAVPVVLQTAPVDPRSLLQGDYVTLGYDISRLESTLFGSGPLQIQAGATVYVALKDQGLVWADMKASFAPFAGMAADERVEVRRLGKDEYWRLRWMFDWNSAEVEQLMSYRTIDGVSREVKAPEGTPYYVLQKHIGPVWQPVRAATTILTPQPGEVILRGQAVHGAWGGSTDVRMTYGIEAFFVPEGEGGWVERLGWSGQRNRLLVRVRVAPDGTGYVDNLLVDGREAFQSGGLNSWAADTPE